MAVIQDRYIDGQLDKIIAGIEAIRKIMNYDFVSTQYKGADRESYYKKFLEECHADLMLVENKAKRVKRK